MIAPARPIENNDAVIFFDFRKDRMKQIVSPFLNPEFKEFDKKATIRIFIHAWTYDVSTAIN